MTAPGAVRLRDRPREQAITPRLDGIHHLKLPTADLERALAFFVEAVARIGVAHSPLLASLQAWLVVLDTPDSTRLRLMTRETHGADVVPDADDPWVTGAHHPGAGDGR